MIDKKTVMCHDYDEGKYTNYQNISILLNLLRKIHIKKVLPLRYANLYY